MTVVAGKPLTNPRQRRVGHENDVHALPDGIEIPKELRDFPLGSLVGAISESADLSGSQGVSRRQGKIDGAERLGPAYLRMYDSNPDDNTGRLGVIVEGTFKK